jgi:preprotein translocase subunit SecY
MTLPERLLQWQLAQLKWQRPASSATCVVGWSSCCWRWWSTASGAHIPVPGIDPNQLQQLFKGQQGGILSLFNMFSGGALSRFTVFALGIMPYISASIIMQLMTYVVPTFEQLKKEGEAGRRKITQYTRYGTLGWPSSSRWALRGAGRLAGPGAGTRASVSA